jgi:hypothetical protein
MNLMGLHLAKLRSELKMTVLKREGGKWVPQEVHKLVGGLTTEASEHPQHPEYVILFGHYTKEQTLRAIGGGSAYIATQVTGLPNDEVPFTPGFA